MYISYLASGRYTHIVIIKLKKELKYDYPGPLEHA